MVPAILDFARRARNDFEIPSGEVLEIGSCNINGTIRDVFEADAESYLGIDLDFGPCVDQVLDVHQLGEHFKPESFDTVLSCECLEHDLTPWITVANMHRVLRPGGYLLVTTPTFGFPLHRHPIDCYRYGEDAYRQFIFEGMEILRLEEVQDGLGHPIICCVGRKPGEARCRPFQKPRTANYSIPANPRVGVVIGTHGTPGYVALHLHVLKHNNPEVQTLVVDDCSPRHDELVLWCQKYGADLYVNPVRLNHTRGDLSVFLQGLLWAKRLQLDLLVKFSRRFLPVTPWVDDLAQLAHTTQHHTYSNECLNSGFGFQTQATGMHVDSHYAMLPTYRRGAQSDPGLVEAFVHQQIAQKIPIPPHAAPHENRHKGYATWPLVGNRHERGTSAYWHDSHSVSEYHKLATSYGLPLDLDDF